MKTLRIPVLICLLAALSITKAYSQPVRTQHQIMIGFLLTCQNNDIVTGDIGYEKIEWSNPQNRTQLRFDDVVLIGRTSRLSYTISFGPYNLVEGTGKSARMMTVRSEGKVLARIPVIINLTEDGTPELEINTGDIKCF